MLTLFLASFADFEDASEELVDSADGGLTKGRPANGLRILKSDSARRCDALGSSAGTIGMLLLKGNAGRPSLDCRRSSNGKVSERLRLANFDGGGGLEPDGRDAW